jgi:hypothetical protein
MSELSGGGSIHFTGKKCCLFDHADAGEVIRGGFLEKVKNYGDAYLNRDGSVRHYLFTWDDGGRMLQRCTKCGALFLVQFSEYHGPEDCYYSDWFQVDDEATAELINATWNGFVIESAYDAPAIFGSGGAYHFRNNG